jgi:hypothetical protein
MKSIRSRLIAGLVLIIVFFLVQAALVYNGLRTARQDVVDQTQKNTQAAAQLSDLAVLAQQVRRYEKEYFVYVSNPERRANYVKEWTGTSDKITKQLQTIRSNANSAFNSDDISKVNNWVGAAEFYGSEMNKIFALVDQRQIQITEAQAATPAPTDAVVTATKVVSKAAAAPAPAPAAAPAPAPTMFSPIEVNTMIGPGKDRFSGTLIKGVSDMSAAKTKATLELGEFATNDFNRLLTIVLATVAVGILIALLLLWKLPQAVTAPLANLSKSIDEMSKGNLEQKNLQRRRERI